MSRRDALCLLVLGAVLCVVLPSPAFDPVLDGAARAQDYYEVFTRVGAEEDDGFGWHVASAGDVNGDGHGDILVAVPGDDAAGESTGSVSLYFGGPGQDDAADLVMIGEAAGDQFGICAASAGDVNGVLPHPGMLPNRVTAGDVFLGSATTSPSPA